MKLRILIIDVYYPAFLKTFYEAHPKLKQAKFNRQKKQIMSEMFGTADFYSHALNQLGHPTEDIILNDEYLQDQWLAENKIPPLPLWQKGIDFFIHRLPLLSSKISLNSELQILNEQIKGFRPDIIYSHNIGYIDPSFLFAIKPKVKLIVGQIACPLPILRNFKPYDLIITSFPHFAPKFKKMGIKSEYLPLCFEPRALNRIPRQKRIYDVTFIGGISRAHKQGFQLLNELAKQIKIDVWGYGKDELDPKSKLYQYHHGEAWGLDMYRLMLQSKITINRHIDVAKNNANNMRLYEATGCGALLLTDAKNNLDTLFEIDKELVTYRSLEELVSKIKYFRSNDHKRRQIAKDGQKRTLRDHNYLVRMNQLIEIIQRYL